MPINLQDLDAFAERIERHMARELDSARREMCGSLDSLSERVDKQNGRVTRLEDRSNVTENIVDRHTVKLNDMNIWQLIPMKTKVFIWLGGMAFFSDMTSHVPFAALWKVIAGLV